MAKQFLIRHVGNMGDMVFFVPPVLETLKKEYPDCHITFATAWGFKETKSSINWDNTTSFGFPRLTKTEHWGKRNQSGFCIHLMMTNPHIDKLIHFHDTKTSVDATICEEDGKSFPTWSRDYYEQQKKSGTYDAVYELDMGIQQDENPITRMYKEIKKPEHTYSNYKLYLTDQDKRIACEVMQHYPRPRIVMLEGIEGTTTRGWVPEKVQALETSIEQTFGVKPIWFGGKYQHYYQGRQLTLRENIATLTYCDVAIGVLSGPLHFAAAVGIPTITLYCDQPLHRAAPAYFLNEYIDDAAKQHKTILGPIGNKRAFLKDGAPFVNATPQEASAQQYTTWQQPGRQETKSCLAAITPDEVMTVLKKTV